MFRGTQRVTGSTFVLVLLVVLLFFVTRWIFEGAYFRKDLVIITVPLENLYGRIQRSGQTPLWAPELAGGYPLLATGQLGYWYGPHMLLRQFFSGAWTLNLSLLLHAWLAAAGTFVFLRRNRIVSIAAGAGALLWPLGATFVGKYESLNLILPFMWAPLLLLFLQLFMESGKLIYLTVWIGVSVLGVSVGHPQMALYVLFLEAVFVFCLTGLARGRWRRSLMTGLGVFLMLGLNSFYLLPILDNLPDTDRASGTLRADARGMFDNQFTPAAFLGAVVPHPFGHHETYRGPTNENELSSYLGPLVLLLAGLGLFTGRRKSPSVWWLSVCLVVIGLMLAIGGYSPVFTWLVTHGWKYFNAPARFFFYTYIGLVFLMAAGLNTCLLYLRQRPLGGAMVGLLLAGTVVPALWVSWSWHEGVPWRFTGEPALAELLRAEEGAVRVLAGTRIADMAPDDDFGIKPWNPVCAACRYRQSFVAPFATLHGLAVKVSGLQRRDGVVTLDLYTGRGGHIRGVSLATREMIDSEWNRFIFRPLTGVAGQDFYFEITSTLEKERAPRLLIHTNPSQQYDPSGRLYNCTSGSCEAVLEADAAFKVVVDSPAVPYYEALAPYVSAGFGVGSTRWVGSLPLRTVQDALAPIGTWGDAFGPGARAVLDRFATTHLIGVFPPHRYAADLDGVALLASVPLGDTFLRLYRNDQAFPRLHFVREVRALAESVDQVNALRRLGDDHQLVVADIQQDAVFDTARSVARLVRDGRTRVVIQTEQDAAGFLVLRDVLLKGWAATIDDRPVVIHRVDGVFRGLLVPAGRHVVAFQYQPPWLAMAVSLQVVSTLLFVILVWYSVKKAQGERPDDRVVVPTVL